jgi:RNA polymerase sigma-70 factor (ECF subfamily)
MEENQINSQFKVFQERRGDAVSFFYELCKDRIYTRLYWWTGSDADAEDLFIETFLRLVENGRKLKDVRHLFGSLYVTAWHLFLQWARKKGHRHETEREWMRRMEMQNEQIEDHRELINKVLQRLSPRRKSIIEMRFFQGMSTKEIAFRLGIADQTVINTLNQTFKILRRQMGDPEEKFSLS